MAQVQILVNNLISATFPIPVDGNKLCKASLRLMTGNNTLDEFLEGGFLCGTVNELFGPSGSGKTQLALQLCIMVQFPKELGGLGGGTFYYSR